MIDEKRLEELRKKGPAAWQVSDYQDLLDTIESLWKVAHAARSWIQANLGIASVQAETELMDALGAIKVSKKRWSI